MLNGICTCGVKNIVDKTTLKAKPKKHQQKGYGKEALRLALDFIRTFPCGKAAYCWLSYEPENEVARKLYRSFGFVEAAEMPEGWDEIPAVLKL